MSTEVITYDGSETVRVERKFFYDWNIKNFECPYAMGPLPSTKFEFGFNNKMQFIGALSLIGDCCWDRMLQLVIKSPTKFLEWQLNVILAPGIEHKTCVLNQHHNYITNALQGCLLENNKYRVDCKIYFVEYRTVNKTSPKLFPTHESKLRDDLVELFKSKKYWDLTLLVEGHEVRAHKLILTSRSKVFAAMFDNNMEEAKANTVTINEIRLEVFQELLRYIYTDEVLNMNKLASELLAASDMYDLPSLKSMCENELSENISIENAAEILILADLYRTQKLKDHTIGFIANNSKAVADTNGWKTIVNNYSHLLADLYLQFLN